MHFIDCFIQTREISYCWEYLQIAVTGGRVAKVCDACSAIMSTTEVNENLLIPFDAHYLLIDRTALGTAHCFS